MGAGKSTLGRALGEAASQGQLASVPHGSVYVDLDDYIEASEGMSVAEIFAAVGEDGFRRREAQALRQVAARDNVIVGCGGGTPCHCGNMDWMLARGTTVLLEASVPVLLRRLLEAQQQRPLLRGLTPAQLSAFIDKTLAGRAPWYTRAACRFGSDFLESEAEIRDSVTRFDAMLSTIKDL